MDDEKFSIPFNRPCRLGDELGFVQQAIASPNASIAGRKFTQLCENWLSIYTGGEALLVNSATSALEMMALLLELGPGDEVIIPSFTFVSTANAFVLRGATVVFADCDETGNINLDHVERLISPRTKALCVVHYGGGSCDMERAVDLCHLRNIVLLEDAAQAIGASFKGKPLGSFGALACYSFHYTKNVTCGEGGALILNARQYLPRALIIKHKGTNRCSFLRGEVKKYTWIDVGSSYVISEMNAAYLYCQLEALERILSRRNKILDRYRAAFTKLLDARFARWMTLSADCTGNAHVAALVFAHSEVLRKCQAYCRASGIEAVVHYVPLHNSPFAKQHPEIIKAEGSYPNTEIFGQQLLRLPIFYDMKDAEADFVISTIMRFSTMFRREQIAFGESEVQAGHSDSLQV